MNGPSNTEHLEGSNQTRYCVGCGYYLLDSERCPECGLLFALARIGGLRQYVGANSLLRIEAGAWLLGSTALFGMITITVDIVVRNALPSAANVVGLINTGVVVVIWLAAVWLVTTPLTSSLGSDRKEVLRCVARCLAIAVSLLSIVTYSLQIGSPVQLPLIRWEVSKLSLIFGEMASIGCIVGTACIIMYLYLIAILNKNLDLGQSMKRHGYMYVAAMFAAGVHAHAMRVSWGRGWGFLDSLLVVLMLLIALAVVVTTFMWTRICWRFANTMRCERHSIQPRDESGGRNSR